ncbi:hypothetical protein Acy02nite_91680 [Actinoplanes cyaneus]|uniref:Uncharacterized protein n=2 Tax=Actinoplanes cyaneus TaxID=52696 RepID=A0A919M9X0_9ACTN|nr:hypothetical protein Acy02nite_91680 [Actinoplanes cyaneus]
MTLTRRLLSTGLWVYCAAMRMTVEELRDATCIVCPAQNLPLGQFDVTAKPGSESRYDPEVGCRVNVMTDVPVCVHPYRVGLPPGEYCSAGVPVPAVMREPPAPSRDALEVPSDVTDLEGWIIAVIRAAGPDRIHQALAASEEIANQRFAERDVVVAMRRVLTVELVRQH